MKCPNCKNSKGKPLNVHPVTSRCPKCKAKVSTNHKGKLVVRGVTLSKDKAATSSSDA